MTSSDAQGVDREIAFAKLNLALHVRKRRPDGYHEIETLFAFLDDGDRLSVEAGDGLELSISGPFAEDLDDQDNLVLDAAKLLAIHGSRTGDASIKLDKQLPVASGIGGGSADAAATLRLLNRFWGLNLSIKELAEISKPLGADVPACVHSQSCRGSGIGQDLELIDDPVLAGHNVLLINPLVPISTAQVFSNWHGRDQGGLVDGKLLELALTGRNDLQDAAVDTVPAIGNILKQLEGSNPVLSRMSGSGATCFGLYETSAAATDAQKKISRNLPDAWTMLGKIR